MSNKAEEYYLFLDFTLLPMHTVGTKLFFINNHCLLAQTFLESANKGKKDPISKHEERGLEVVNLSFPWSHTNLPPSSFVMETKQKQPGLPVPGCQKIEFWWNWYPTYPSLCCYHPFGKGRSSDSYSEFPLRQVQRSACSSRQTQLCLGEEPVQWVGSLTAPSTRTNPCSGNAERTIQHLWIHPKDAPLYFHSSADTDILYFQKCFSWIMWRPVFIFVAVLNHLIVAWTVQKGFLYSALHFWHGHTWSWSACVTALWHTCRCVRQCTGIGADGQ